MKKYKWIETSKDGSFVNESNQEFTSFKECYDDMRNAVLKKIKWNTELCDFNDIPDGGYIGYKVCFSIEKIVLESNSGVDTYEIKVINSMKTIELTEEQVKMIVHALKTNIRVNQESIDRMYEICGENEHTRETGLNIVEGNMRLRTLLNYIEQV